MPTTMHDSDLSRHRLLSDVAAKPVKAHIRKADERWMRAVGRVVREVRGALSLKEFAAAIDRDERQVARWEEAIERPHLDAIFAIERFRQPLVIGLAGLPGSGIEIETTLRARRRSEAA